MGIAENQSGRPGQVLDQSIQRIATRGVEMPGKVLKKDGRIRWFISSASRDPEAFPDSERFHITRHPNQHVTFGSGVHHCLGVTLARGEQEVLKAVAERFPRPRAWSASPVLCFGR